MTAAPAPRRGAAGGSTLRAALAATLFLGPFAPTVATADSSFDAITLEGLDACVARLVEGDEQGARDCLAPMMAICVGDRQEGDAPEELRACIEAETQAWQPLIARHFEQIEARDDPDERTRNAMMRAMAEDVVKNRCPELSQDGVSDAYCELRTTGSLAIDLRLEYALETARGQ